MRTQSIPQAIIDRAERIVVKVGSETIIKGGEIDKEWLEAFAKDIAVLKRRGKDVFVVTSGAIALGRGVLKIDPRIPTKDLPLRTQQIASTVGQPRLMWAYYQACGNVDLIPQQLLLTSDILQNEQQLANLKNTVLSQADDCGEFRKLLPVFNEDDALVTDEIKFGDNDGLGAIVTEITQSGLYIIFSKPEGLFTDDPERNPKAEFVSFVPDVRAAFRLANDNLNGLSRGGMTSKLEAARRANESGAYAIIAKGQGIPHCLKNLIDGTEGFRSTVCAPIATAHP